MCSLILLKTLGFFKFLNIHLLRIFSMEKLMTEEAEKFNGWAAMLGFVVAVGTYATTGQIIPGIF